jgi:hypothetical protein
MFKKEIKKIFQSKKSTKLKNIVIKNIRLKFIIKIKSNQILSDEVVK